MKASGVGGQAVLEGVMMKSGDKYAVAVRTPNNDIEIKTGKLKSIADKNAFFRIPIVRGIVAFVESMKIGISTLNYSASFYEDDQSIRENNAFTNMEDTEDVKDGGESKDKKKEKKAKSSFWENLVSGFAAVLAVVLALFLFVAVPVLLANWLMGIVKSEIWRSVIEGVIRIVIFVLYILVISCMKDIKRVFMYHGAEHKAINCIENGYTLTVKNVKKQSREHRRCGTSFMLDIIVISSIVFVFISVETVWLRMLLRILLVPVIAGISYEIIRFAGRSEGKFAYIVSRPGMWLQSLTTREPDDDMIEVAIQAVEEVFDWRAFLGDEGKKNGKKTKKRKNDSSKGKKRVSEPVSREKIEKLFEAEEKEQPVELTNNFDIKFSDYPQEENEKIEFKEAGKRTDNSKVAKKRVDDEVLQALDMFFSDEDEKK